MIPEPSRTAERTAEGPRRGHERGMTMTAASRRADRVLGALERRAARVAGRVGVDLPVRVRGGVGRGLRISLRNASGDYARGDNELPVQHAVVTHLRPGGVFYDIGSNVGFFALLAAHVVGPGGHVYAFEPVPENAACIRANARANRFSDTITVIGEAAGARTGTAELWLDPHPGGATLSASDAGSGATSRLEVRTVAVDELVGTGRLRPPTVVKIDVEGAEPAVLDGMAETIAAHHPVLIVEVDAADADTAQRKYDALATRVAQAGYRVEQLPRSYTETAWNVLHFAAVPEPS